MEVDAHLNLGKDQMSDCRSYGSYYHPSSQSRKISIGVAIDSLSKKKFVSTKNNKNTMPNGKLLNSNKANNIEANNRSVGKENLSHVPKKITSPWISTRPFEQKIPTPDNVLCSKATPSLKCSSGKQKKSIGESHTPVTCGAQVLATQTSSLKSSDGMQKNFNGITDKRSLEMNGNSMQEFTFTTAPNGVVPENRVKEDKADKIKNTSTDTLRMKLFEILGNVSSPKSQHSDYQAPEVGADNLKPDRNADPQRDSRVKPRQNSDTIETDSEYPDHVIRRPVTRSLVRQQAIKKMEPKLIKTMEPKVIKKMEQKIMKKMEPKKSKVGASSSYRQRVFEKSTFSFEEGRNSNLDGAANFYSSIPNKKKCQKYKSAIEPRKIQFHDMDEKDDVQRETYRNEAPIPAKKAPSEKTSSICNSRGTVHKYSSQTKIDFQKPRSSFFEENIRQSSVTKMKSQPGDVDSLVSPVKRDQQGNHFPKIVEEYFRQSSMTKRKCHPGDTDSPVSPLKENQQKTKDLDSPVSSLKGHQQKESSISSPKNVVDDPPEDFPSPTLRFKGSTLSPLTSSPPETVGINPSPAPEDQKISEGNIRSYMNLGTPKATFYQWDEDKELSDSSEKLEDNSPRKITSGFLNEDTEDNVTESLSDDRDSQDSPVIKGHTERESFEENDISETFKFKVHHSINKAYSPAGRKVNALSPTQPSQTESRHFEDPSEQNQENGLERTVNYFASAIENFERKLKSAVKKKSSEILMSVFEGIHEQLQSVELQIQTDVGKLSSHGKSKRKRTETKFQDQQEQFRLMREKFNKEISHHIHDCRNTLEGLEADQIELRGVVKKQKASHQKLILQFEKDTDTQFNDAQRRILAVTELAKGKMHQMKWVIAECLKECILD